MEPSLKVQSIKHKALRKTKLGHFLSYSNTRASIRCLNVDRPAQVYIKKYLSCSVCDSSLIY